MSRSPVGIADRGDSAADHDSFGVHRADQAGQGPAERSGAFGEDRTGGVAAGARATGLFGQGDDLTEVVHVGVSGQLTEARGHGRSGGDGFEMAGPVAVAAPSGRLGYGDVAELAGRRVGPADQSPVHDQAAADAGAHTDVQRGPAAPAGTVGLLGEGEDIGVVVSDHEQARRALSSLLRWVPAQRGSRSLADRTTPLARSMTPPVPMPRPSAD
ncbi:hypothetical protein TPA0910_00220 [Streptomyces hygroscopicus subsp. sporocinereus]|uniref:Uncharacterized protein n=1 Tax=Streptomyces hygroscopicus TaxID=1912 RepID=A0ABQ3TQH4_STRHY|nr:hypothetical protein TPA0910_00220 [Streptomyces hygroscopicus]